MKKYIIIGILTVVVIVTFAIGTNHQKLSGFLTSSVTATSSTMPVLGSSSSTVILTSGLNLQYLRLTTVSSTDVYCGFGLTSSTGNNLIGSGLHLEPSTDATERSWETYDANLLAKGLRCNSNATATLSIIYY